jgi:hypothetical protein
MILIVICTCSTTILWILFTAVIVLWVLNISINRWLFATLIRLVIATSFKIRMKRISINIVITTLIYLFCATYNMVWIFNIFQYIRSTLSTFWSTFILLILTTLFKEHISFILKYIVCTFIDWSNWWAYFIDGSKFFEISTAA